MIGSAERWNEISRIVDAALDRPEHERHAFVADACAHDEALRREVESLLACSSDTNQILAAAPAAVIAEAIDVVAQGIATDARSLIGRRIGHYLIEARLGVGGMGEVYKAIDTRLRRPVALKILPKFLRDAGSRRRFDREAQAIAAVRHPHICVVHDIGQDGDIEFLAMEYLEGETLAERLRRGPLPDVRRCAIEIAEALAATHRAGITHRDLKPGNVMLTTSGAKLLDFGLATLNSAMAGPIHESDDADSSPATALIAGTPGYMSPEQVQGMEIDHRSDIFALGSLLYEMVTGRKAFEGATRSDLAQAILTTEPPAMGTDVPRASRRLEPTIRRCLAKDPDDRWQSAADVANELRRVTDQATAAGHAARKAPRRLAAAAIGTTCAALVAAALWRGEDPASGLFAQPKLLTGSEQLEVDPAPSPDGRFVAYSAGNALGVRVFIREIGANESKPLLANSEEYQFQPRWSPDGRWILYITRDGAFVAPATGGGMPRRLASNNGVADHSQGPNEVARITAAAWSPDGLYVAIAHGRTIHIVPFNGGEGRRLRTTAADALHHCNWSPDGRWIACVTGNWRFPEPGQHYGNIAPSEIVLVPTMGGALVEITRDRKHQNLSPVWSSDGSQLYFASSRFGKSDIYVVDIAQGRPRGTPVRVTTGATINSFAFFADPAPSATSKHGGQKRIIYTEYTLRSNLWKLPIPANVTAGPVGLAGASQVTSAIQAIEFVSVSPDERWLLFDSNAQGNSDIFRIPIEGGSPEPVTSGERYEFAPVVSPDNTSVAYHAFSEGGTRDIFVQPLSGGPAVQVTRTAGEESYPFWNSQRQLTYFDQTSQDVNLRGQFTVERDDSGKWGTPHRVPLPDGVQRQKLLWNGLGVYARDRGVEINTADLQNPRWLYPPDPTRPRPLRIATAPGEFDHVYLKAQDDQGRASFWRLSLSGAPPVQLVQFDDLSRPSIRFDFTVGRGQFFFTLDEHRSSIFIADVTR